MAAMIGNVALWKRVNAIAVESSRARGETNLAIIDYLRGFAKESDDCAHIFAGIDLNSSDAIGFDPITDDSFEGASMLEKGIASAAILMRAQPPGATAQQLNESIARLGDSQTLSVSESDIERMASGRPEYIPSPAMLGILRNVAIATTITAGYSRGLPHVEIIREVVAYERRCGGGPLTRLGVLDLVESRLKSR